MRCVLVVLIAISGCGDEGNHLDASAESDMGIGELGLVGDGPGSLRGAFTAIGCAKLETTPMGEVSCSGRAPLTITFVPSGAGVDAFVWSFDKGMPAGSKATTPSVTWVQPGVYQVMLAAGGAAGQITATGTVIVSSGTTGSPCLDDIDCDASSNLSCICKPGEGGCVGALGVGFCSRGCSGGVCNAGEVCVDLTRGGAYNPSGGSDAGGGGDVWRRALCLPGCQTTSDCRTGFLCRQLPVLPAGGMAGGTYSWQNGCFADVLGDDGDSCLSASGEPQAWACLSGRCDDFGARGLCSSDCTTSSDCPSAAACATYMGSPTRRGCLSRCDTTQLCTSDPLLDCEAPNQMGGLGFTISPTEPSTQKYCAPLRCSMASQCAPSGTCTAMGGGSFCIRD
jgi:PKD repeat protein